MLVVERRQTVEVIMHLTDDDSRMVFNDGVCTLTVCCTYPDGCRA
jgi:hypothetical protein